MTIPTFLRFLGGSRQAILTAVSATGLLPLGLLFVLSAGLAREYDAEDLLHEPWYAFLPLAASLVSSFCLFALIYGVAYARGVREPLSTFFPLYLRFLGLFWLTAPLAWIYAIPVERFLAPEYAVAANLYFLGAVSLWRVLLITRVISILYQCSYVAVLLVVMLFSDGVVFVVLQFTELPIINVMGGIELTASEALIQRVAINVGLLAVLSFPLWLIGAIVVAIPKREKWKLIPLETTQKTSAGLYVLALLLLLGGVSLLPFTQPQQQNRYAVEQAFAQNELAAGLKYMSARESEDFPPHWRPPPHLSYRDPHPNLGKLIVTAEFVRSKPWVQELFLEKLNRGIRPQWHPPGFPLTELTDAELGRYAALLESLPNGSKLAKKHSHEIERALEDDTLSSRRREIYEKLKASYREKEESESIDDEALRTILRQVGSPV